jgi:carboxypeptidase Q
MKKLILPALCAIVALPSIASAQSKQMGILSRMNNNATGGEQAGDTAIAAMRDAALEGDTLAYSITEGLTTEIGPRLAGTEAEARARAWAVERLTSLGFSNVGIETYQMPTWVRGVETAEIVAPYPQSMHVTALGRSASTGDAGIQAEIAAFASVADLRAAPIGSLTGKIVYVSHNMERTQDGSGYGFAGPARWNAASLASERGAAGIVIRSVGTDNHRNPHTGGTNWAEGVSPIPAGALSNPDADNLERMVALGRPVTMHLTLTPQWLGDQESGNVIADIPGSDPDLPMVIAACHLDSWDLATGAFDDAAGCGIITAAAHRILESGAQPRRTIRLLWAGAEEVGLFGARAYAERHPAEEHAVAAESDFGADRIWRVEFNLPDSAAGDADRITRLLAPLGIPRSSIPATGGADTSPLVAGGVWAIDLQQDGTRYFDLHHTPDDTFDKVDPAQMRQNVAAWTVMLSVMSNSEADLGIPQMAE